MDNLRKMVFCLFRVNEELDFVRFLASKSLSSFHRSRMFLIRKGMVKWPFLKIKNHSDSLEPPTEMQSKNVQSREEEINILT